MIFESDLKEDASEKADKSVTITGELSLLTQPDGSATFNLGDEASAMSAVYGPGDVRIKMELIDRAYVDVTFNHKTAQTGCVERYTQHIIAKTCETAIKTALHPKTAISIIIQVLHGTDSSSLLACCINSAFLALLDAGIAMDFLVGAVSCQIKQDGSILLDCSGDGDDDDDDENKSVATVTAAFENHSNELISCVANGKYNANQLKKCINLCNKGSVDIFKFYRMAVDRKLSKVV